jgi:outer membrane protein assembly factor BamD (BamD/ComL family)
VAVAKRTNAILLDYQGTSVIPTTLAIQLQAYEELGLSELAEDTRRIIELNYGNSS